MIPPTFKARVARWSRATPGSFSIYLYGLTPNQFFGTSSQLHRLLTDFVCVDGALYEWHSDFPFGVHPYSMLVNASVHQVSEIEARRIIKELDLSYDLLRISIGRYEFSPDRLPISISSRPAYEWAFRLVHLEVYPPPSSQLLSFKHGRWWLSWA